MGRGDSPASPPVTVRCEELPNGGTSAATSTLLGSPGSREEAASQAGEDVPGSGRQQPRWYLRVKDRIREYVVPIAVGCLLLGAVIGYIPCCASQGSSHSPVPPSCPPVPPSCPPVPPSCPNKWLTSDGKCYFVSQEAGAWDSSLEFCRSHGGTLLPAGNETQREISSLYDLSGDHWIGLRKDTDSGQWRQLDDAVWTSEIQYDNSQMECSCVNSGRYVALDCSTARRWICVKSL